MNDSLHWERPSDFNHSRNWPIWWIVNSRPWAKVQKVGVTYLERKQRRSTCQHLHVFVGSSMFGSSSTLIVFLPDGYWWPKLVPCRQRQEQKRMALTKMLPEQELVPIRVSWCAPGRTKMCRLVWIASKNYNHHSWSLLPKKKTRKTSTDVAVW